MRVHCVKITVSYRKHSASYRSWDKKCNNHHRFPQICVQTLTSSYVFAIREFIYSDICSFFFIFQYMMIFRQGQFSQNQNPKGILWICIIYNISRGIKGCWIQICCVWSSKMPQNASKLRNPTWPPPPGWNLFVSVSFWLDKVKTWIKCAFAGFPTWAIWWHIQIWDVMWKNCLDIAKIVV